MQGAAAGVAAAGGSLAPGAGGAAAGAAGMQGRGPAAVMGQQQQQGNQRFIMSHPGQTPPHQQQYPFGQSNVVRRNTCLMQYTM